jgi:pilus assembly protein Flp/PilA
MRLDRRRCKPKAGSPCPFGAIRVPQRIVAFLALRGNTVRFIKRFINQLEPVFFRLRNDETGQGIVEYMLIIALVAFAATAGMSSLASGVNSAMTKIASVLGVYIS